jgi:hypothetical protein
VAGGCQRDLGTQTLKQRRIQFGFQLPHLRAYSGLRPKTRLRSLREALQADNFEERMELIQIHGEALLGF